MSKPARIPLVELLAAATAIEQDAGMQRQTAIRQYALINTLLRQHKPTPEERAMVRYVFVCEGHYHRGLTWEQSYEYASDMLAREPGFGGSPHTMRRDFKLAQKFARQVKVRADSP
jgi:hypothetical protein